MPPPPPLQVPDVAGHGEQRRQVGRRAADLGRVRLQARLLVVVQLADNDATEVLVLPVAVVQQVAHAGRAGGLVAHQLVILPHEHGAGQQGVQALVEAGLRHLVHNLLPPGGDPGGDGAVRRRAVPGGRGLVTWWT